MDNVKDFPENIEEEILKECLEIAVNELVKEDDYFTPASIFSALRKIKAHAKDQSDKKTNILCTIPPPASWHGINHTSSHPTLHTISSEGTQKYEAPNEAIVQKCFK